MITPPRDPDSMSTTEAIALASSVLLGIAIWLNGQVPWPAERGASVVIVCAFAVSVALTALARAPARARVAVGLLGTVAGAVTGGPYVARTGFSATGLAAISTFGSAMASLCLAATQVLATRADRRPMYSHLFAPGLRQVDIRATTATSYRMRS